MEIKVTKEELRKRSIFVATPMYGGMNHGLYAKSCLDLQGMCINEGIGIRFSYLFNESLITRARNYCVDEFLHRSDCTHLLFIDSDIHFNPQDVVTMLAMDLDVVGGPYPKKTIKWNSVKEALRKNPDIPNVELEKVTGDYVFNPVKTTEQFTVLEPLEVLEIGTGFMMVKREVFAKWEKEYPQFRYKPDHVGQAHFDGSRFIHAYFDTVIDNKYAHLPKEIREFFRKNPNATPEDTIKFLDDDQTSAFTETIRNPNYKPQAPGETTDSQEPEFIEVSRQYSHRYLSEDYMFCQWWRNMGGKIWLCPWMVTDHIGTYHFKGNMPAVAHYVQAI